MSSDHRYHQYHSNRIGSEKRLEAEDEDLDLILIMLIDCFTEEKCFFRFVGGHQRCQLNYNINKMNTQPEY